MRNLILYIASSLDGYIAAPGDDLKFLHLVQKEGEDYGYSGFYESVDTVIIGRKTYDWVVKEIGSSPHPDKTTYVITHKARPAERNTIFYTGDMNDLVKRLKLEQGLNIFCDGGAEIVNELQKNKLIDEMIISVIPVLLGEGIRLFKDGRPGQNLVLLKSRQFDTGLVQLHYKCGD